MSSPVNNKDSLFNIKGDKNINTNPKGLLEHSPVYKPFRYPWAYEAWLAQQRVHWLPEEVALTEDIKDWNTKLNESSKNLITQIFRFFTQADCVPLNTRILTAKGWVKIGDLKPDDRVAQVSDNGKLSFVKPIASANSLKRKNTEKEIIHFTSPDGRFNISVTPGHNMIFKRGNELIRQKARDVEFQKGDKILVGAPPEITEGNRELTQVERSRIAFKERGHKTRNKNNHLNYTFCPVTEDERAYLFQLLHAEMHLPLSTERAEYNDEEYVYLTVNDNDDKNDLLKDLNKTSTYKWVDLENITSEWARSFIVELSIYGAFNDKKQRYITQNKEDAEKVQIIALLAGFQAFLYPHTTPGGLKSFAVDIVQNPVIILDDVEKSVEPSDEWVTCVKVPEGNILVERNGIPVVVGNCEVNNAYIHVYARIFKPTEIQMMFTAFANMETTHIAGYSYLLDTLGLPEVEYQAFLKYKEMKDKYEAMHDYEIRTKSDAAFSVAKFSAFMEGLQLFASFAILLNFPRHNLLKGMGQIVTWSVRDETCVSEDTEVLTSKGWKLFKDLDKTELLAQFEGLNNEITFAKPLHYTKKPYKGDMVRIQFNESNSKADILVTPDHDIVIKGHESVIKVKAETLHNYKTGYSFPVGYEKDGVKIESWASVDKLSISRIPYDATVYCATMPKGTLVTRRNGSIGFIGNCHVNGMIKLFRTFIAENPEIWTEEFRQRIIDECIECVKHEDAFIDLAFEMGDAEGLAAEEVKQYIRFIADRRLMQLSIEPIYHIEKNPLPWIDDMLNAIEHTNFFENRATEYSRAGTTGTWEDAFSKDNFIENTKPSDEKTSKWTD